MRLPSDRGTLFASANRRQRQKRRSASHFGSFDVGWRNFVGNDVAENIDMNDDSNDGILRPNGWGRNDDVYLEKWFHSDMKDMAYYYVYPLYDDLKTKGNLK